MVTPCATCASLGHSCCKGYQIYLTSGDIVRISGFLKHSDFYTYEPPILSDIEPDYDTCWLPLIMSEGNRVRVLNRTDDKQCCLAFAMGCLLPLETRPLICRLFPYDFINHHILGIDSSCPISKECNWQSILDGMEMTESKAQHWVDLLYEEIAKDLPVHGQI